LPPYWLCKTTSQEQKGKRSFISHSWLLLALYIRTNIHFNDNSASMVLEHLVTTGIARRRH
jgi:hypothetical protein